MTEQRPTLEKIAPTIEEAIENGLDELGLTREAVEVEILDEGNKGLFGLGSRQARVLLTIKDASESTSEQETEPTEEFIQPSESTISEPDLKAETSATPEDDRVLILARETVTELLEKMKVKADVTASYIDEDDYNGRKPILVDIHGNDLSILIGRKAETLNALQYITSLIVGKELGRSVPLSVDVEGYRTRRQKQIKHLANRVANQVAQTGRSQSLEPMPASERRIIHIELRDHPEVYTESIGEGERRKVVIYPKH
ncbi:MAG: RNA-binding cell elongation regulator Jag/EloR [Anaerolineales bacterium]